MADKQIKQFTEETSVDSADLYLIQKGSNDEYRRVEASNIVPAGTVDFAKLASDALSVVAGTATGSGDLSTSYVSVGELTSLPAGVWLLLAFGSTQFSVAQDTSVIGRVRNTTDGTDIQANAIRTLIDNVSSTVGFDIPWSIILPFTLSGTKTVQVQFVASTGSGTTVVGCSSILALKLTSYA